MLFVDDRERSELPSILKRIGVPLSIVRLKVGDYVAIGPTSSVCITSKSASDYIGSICSGHLSDEIWNILCNYNRGILIIHGSIEEALQYRKMKRQTYANYLAGCIIEETKEGKNGSLSVVNFASPWDAAELIKTAHNIVVTDDICREPTATKVKIPEDLRKIYSIMSLGSPLVGKVRAQALRNHFGTIKNIVNASVEQISVVPGVGKKTANSIFKRVNE